MTVATSVQQETKDDHGDRAALRKMCSHMHIIHRGRSCFAALIV